MTFRPLPAPAQVAPDPRQNHTANAHSQWPLSGGRRCLLGSRWFPHQLQPRGRVQVFECGQLLCQPAAWRHAQRRRDRPGGVHPKGSEPMDMDAGRSGTPQQRHAICHSAALNSLGALAQGSRPGRASFPERSTDFSPHLRQADQPVPGSSIYHSHPHPAPTGPFGKTVPAQRIPGPTQPQACSHCSRNRRTAAAIACLRSPWQPHSKLTKF